MASSVTMQTLARADLTRVEPGAWLRRGRAVFPVPGPASKIFTCPPLLAFFGAMNGPGAKDIMTECRASRDSP